MVTGDGKGTYEVHVYVLKSFSWRFEGLEWRSHMLLYFATLAFHTGSSPSCYIRRGRRPDKATSDELFCGADAWMRKAVDDFKNFPPPSVGDQRTRFATTDIANDVHVVHSDSLKTEAGVSIAQKALSVGIGSLLLGESDKIDALGSDGINGYR